MVLDLFVSAGIAINITRRKRGRIRNGLLAYRADVGSSWHGQAFWMRFDACWRRNLCRVTGCGGLSVVVRLIPPLPELEKEDRHGQ